MSAGKREYSEYLRAVAEFRGYRFPERIEPSKRRLLINDGLIAAVFDAPEFQEASYLSPPSVPTARDASDDLFRFPVVSERNLEGRSAGELAALVSAGQLLPTEAVRPFLERAERRRELNAFITLDRARVLRDAEEVALRLKRRESLPLAGVAVAVKDAMLVRGYPFTCGSKAIEPTVSAQDAEAVARLRAAGAVVVGTTNLDELGYAATGLHAPFGRIANPRAPGRIAGGSSGGSAAAVAANLAPVAIGTDTGGALRLPAACCGIVGLKPTHGAISNIGFMTRAPSLDSIGPMTRTVADCALVYEVLAGLEAGVTLGRNPLGRRFRFGVPADYFFDDVDEQVAAAVARAVERVGSIGTVVPGLRIDDIKLAPAAHFMTVGPEAAQMHWQLLAERGDMLGEDLRARLEAGQFVLAIDYIKAQRIRQHLRNALLAAMKEVDVLLVPTVCVAPPQIDESSISITAKASAMLGKLTCPFNVTGLPAMTIPCGITSDGAPIGLQLAARPGEESVLLRAAYACERVLQDVVRSAS